MEKRRGSSTNQILDTPSCWSNLENPKGVTPPAVKTTLEEVFAKFPQLEASQTRLCRDVVMKAAYLTQDKSDLSMSAKELARAMHKPTEISMTHLKLLERYLKKRLRHVECFVDRHPLEALCDWTRVVIVTMRVPRNTQEQYQFAAHLVSKCHVAHTQPYHSVAARVSIMETSNAQPLAWARHPRLQISACVC